MSETVLQVENLGKLYRLGEVSTGTISHDLNRWWAKVRGKEDPYKKVGEINDRATKGDSDYVWALRDINFEVKEGEVLGIIGRNGAGKSTLLKILSQITAPTTGDIRIRGRVASLLEVGTGFHPELTGRENIFLNGAILGMTKTEIRRKFDEIVDFAEVERYIDTPVKRYSSGMYVRLAFGVAAHLEPEILIVDEVLAVGDAEFQKKCLGKMSQIASEGRTILFVSHNMAAVKNLCTRGIVFQNGQMLYDGYIDKAVDTYINKTFANSKAEVVWQDTEKAPGDGNVRIVGVRVLDKRGTVCENLFINEDFYVEIDFLNKKEGAYLTPNFQLFTSSGIGVFSSANWASASANQDAYANVAYKKGLFRSRMKVPANFLNEGSYLVNALILQDVSVIRAYANEIISFQIIDSGEMKKEYLGEWLGIVRPKLEWHTSTLKHMPEEGTKVLS